MKRKRWGGIEDDLFLPQKKRLKVKLVKDFEIGPEPLGTDAVLFFDIQEPFGQLSPIYCKSKHKSLKLKIDGIRYTSVHHYVQCQKYLYDGCPSVNRAFARQIIKCSTGYKAYLMGNQFMKGTCKWKKVLSELVLKYQKRGIRLRDDWDIVKRNKMAIAMHELYKQNMDLRLLLKDTGKGLLVYDDKRNSYWGVGQDFRGKNVVGKLLMKIRDKYLRRDEYEIEELSISDSDEEALQPIALKDLPEIEIDDFF
eukprot:TRINITY_DN5775_c0_g1_i1.p1 TRINITY_DN5775_c0_g1~~TRINITY_DN5775_c0_g1_i1.p1  ORF type:complete len:253 (+),score=44.00 TRINITY_DN5775_c0_g1_i1:23-781(+)